MVERVFVHIGLPKTATSYLQTIIWGNREQLRKVGVTVPGSERRDHLWSSREIREDKHHANAPEQHRTAWSRVRTELARASGTGLISHEFFAAASAEQARRMVADLDAEVHVVVTAREPLGLFTASWQESLKNGATTPMADYARRVSNRSTDIWNWRTLDLRLVLERWSQAVPQERVHVAGARSGRGAGRRVAPVRRVAGNSGRRLRPVPLLPEPVDGGGRGRDAAPHQRSSSSTSGGGSTRASTSGPSWPTSGWSRVGARSSGPSRTRWRSAAIAGDGPWPTSSSRTLTSPGRSSTCWSPTSSKTAGCRRR